MRRVPVVDTPVADRTGVGRVGVDTEDDLRPLRLAIAERRVRAADVVGRAVDRVQMHRGLHRRQLPAPCEVALDQLVGELVDEVRAPVALQALGVEPVEQALQGGVGHGTDGVQERRADVLDRREQLCQPLPRNRRCTTSLRRPCAGATPAGTGRPAARSSARRSR